MSTIYITEQDALLQIQHHYFKVFHQQKQCVCLPIRNISHIILFGNIHLPREVIQILHSHQIPILYFTPEGEFLGRLEKTSQLKAKYLTYQRKRARDVEFNRATAESIIWAKLHNQQVFLQAWTSPQKCHTTQTAFNYLTLLMDDLPMAKTIKELREYEEEANILYNLAFSTILNSYCKCPRTNANLVRGLLNLGYQLLHQYIYTLVCTSELHPDYGIFHHEAHHEFPLACDLMAEFRAPIVDDLVLNFVRHLPQVHVNSAASTNGNGKKRPLTLLQTFLQYWEAKLRTFILHPYAGEVSYRQCMELQVREYLACLLGDVEYYRPLALKFNPAHTNFTNTVEPQTVPLKLVKR